MTDHSRKPAAFHLKDVEVVAADDFVEDGTHRDLALMVDEVDEAAAQAERPAAKSGWSWGALFVTALGGLVSLAIGIAVDQLIRDLFSRADWLGWLGAALAALVALAAIALIIRELAGMMRLRRIDKLRRRAEDAAETDDRGKAKAVLADIVALYRSRPETARGRAAIAEHRGEIIDGKDLITLAERDLMRPLDAEARHLVMDSAKRVSVVTAVSPRAVVDLLFVLAESLRLIRRVSTLYGGRPGGIGFFRLTRQVLGHLAVTGAIAVGDSLVQELVGHGLAAKLSARLGEGVVNGLLTARIGIAAIDVCRPLPFRSESRPKIGDVFTELIRSRGGKDSPKGGKKTAKTGVEKE